MKFPTYTCHKVVQAATIVAVVKSIDPCIDDSYSLLVKPNMECDETYLVHTSEPAMMNKASIGDYFVVYDDWKHTSVSPKKVFEDGYKLDVVPETMPEPRFIVRPRFTSSRGDT